MMAPRRMVFLAMLVAACGEDSRPGTSGGAIAAKVDPAKVERLATELAAITGAPPAPSPALPAGVTLTPANTLVIARGDLAVLRGEPAESTARAPERGVLAELLVEARGGAVQNPYVVTDASRATALASSDSLAYVAVVVERSWVKDMSRQTVSIWDRAAKRWSGALWITLPLTSEPDKEMAMFSSGGTQLGPAFTVSEKDDEREARHRWEIAGVVRKAIAERAGQWVALGRSEMPGPPFEAGQDKVYAVPLVAGSPARGGADAGVVVQVFAYHGDPNMALLVARITQVYGDRVRVVWRDLPRAYLKDTEPAAHAAHEVLAAAGEDAFWRYVEGLAARKGTAVLTTDELVGEAERLGVEGARVRTAIETRAHRGVIDADLAAFRAAKLPTSPSIATFTNGWTLSTTSFAAHATRIDAALN